MGGGGKGEVRAGMAEEFTVQTVSRAGSFLCLLRPEIFSNIILHETGVTQCHPASPPCKIETLTDGCRQNSAGHRVIDDAGYLTPSQPQRSYRDETQFIKPRVKI